MAKRSRTSVEQYHDRVAGLYDTIYDGSPYWEVVFDITWRHILEHLPRDLSTRCLDVGCGTGRWGLRLLKSGYRTDFLDISQKMLDQVSKKLSKFNEAISPIDCMRQDKRIPCPTTPENSLRLYHASVDDLTELPKEEYGFIIGQGDPLNCAQRPERTLKQMTRALAPGGIMIMSVDNRYAGIYHYFKNNDIPGLQNFLKTGRTNWVTDNENEQYPMIMFTPDQIRRMVAARGLELVSLIGKTVLPLRRFRDMLADKTTRDELVRLEESLNSIDPLLGNAAHLEFVARKPN